MAGIGSQKATMSIHSMCRISFAKSIAKTTSIHSLCFDPSYAKPTTKATHQLSVLPFLLRHPSLRHHPLSVSPFLLTFHLFQTSSYRLVFSHSISFRCPSHIPYLSYVLYEPCTTMCRMSYVLYEPCTTIVMHLAPL